jgi:hypothetical protein
MKILCEENFLQRKIEDKGNFAAKNFCMEEILQ